MGLHVGIGLTIAEKMRYLLPSYKTERPTWPPDAFAIAACLLKESGAYTEIVNGWPPKRSDTSAPFAVEAWQDEVVGLGKAWRNALQSEPPTWPRELEDRWKRVIASEHLEVENIVRERELVEALTFIVAAADQTCFGFGILGKPASSASGITDKLQMRSIGFLRKGSSLCDRIHPSRARVLPKLHNPLSGITLRSLTHNLAYWDRSEVKVEWKQISLPKLDWGMNLLVLPWPLRVNPSSVRSAALNCGDLLPRDFGFFTYAMGGSPVSVSLVKRLLDAAEEMVGQVDAVVFPELSMTREDFDHVYHALDKKLVIAGVGTAATNERLGTNEVAIANDARFRPSYQAKHHRWRLDGDQIAQYGFGPSLAQHKWWWEAIELRSRSCTFVTATNWLTFCVLICEDLARQDPVAELVRSVGPNLVVVLLMDGPQLPERWSARYATVLAEDPRSSVLTVTCAGLVDLANMQRNGGRRSIGLWKDALSGPAREIVLEQDAQGVVLSLGQSMHKEWTSDGRHDDESTGYLRLTGMHQVRVQDPEAPTDDF